MDLHNISTSLSASATPCGFSPRFKYNAALQTKCLHSILCLYNGSRLKRLSRQSTLKTMELALSTEDVSSDAR